MAKKLKIEAIDNILGGVEPQEGNEHVEPAKSLQKANRGKGRPREEDYEARTFRVKKELVQKLRIIALKEGALQKDILEFALESAIERYEAKHGAINVSQEHAKSVRDIF